VVDFWEDQTFALISFPAYSLRVAWKENVTEILLQRERERVGEEGRVLEIETGRNYSEVDRRARGGHVVGSDDNKL